MQTQIKRVLVVDDEEDLTWSISKHLSKDKSKYDLTTVNSGKRALEVLSQLPVDLVISDIRMPEISGLDLLLKIKDFYPNTKVIIMTAYGSSEIQEEANKRGCLKYIEKPFEINELRQLILEALKEQKGFRGTISDFQLSDLIQINCFGRLTTALSVHAEDGEGVIYFDEGNIVHAERGDKEGEEAIYEMLSWAGGNFSTNRGQRSPKDTVIKGWQSILLEGMRRVDEAKPAKQVAQEVEREQRQKMINAGLDKLLGVKGVKLASVFDLEGFPLASRIATEEINNLAIRELAPIFSTFLKQVDGIGKEMNLSNSRDLILEFENAILKITRIPGRKEFLIILSDSNCNLSHLRMEARQQLKNLSAVL